MYGLISLPHDGELVLGAEFFLLHVVQGGVVHRQHAQFGVAYLAIELLVALIQAAKLRIALDQHFDVILLVLEHQPTSSAKNTHAKTLRITAEIRANLRERAWGWCNQTTLHRLM